MHSFDTYYEKNKIAVYLIKFVILKIQTFTFAKKNFVNLCFCNRKQFQKNADDPHRKNYNCSIFSKICSFVENLHF